MAWTYIANIILFLTVCQKCMRFVESHPLTPNILCFFNIFFFHFCLIPLDSFWYIILCRHLIVWLHSKYVKSSVECLYDITGVCLQTTNLHSIWNLLCHDRIRCKSRVFFVIWNRKTIVFYQWFSENLSSTLNISFILMFFLHIPAKKTVNHFGFSNKLIIFVVCANIAITLLW